MPLPVAYQNQFKHVSVRAYWLPEFDSAETVIPDKSDEGALGRGPIHCSIAGSFDSMLENPIFNSINGSSVCGASHLAEDDRLSVQELTTLSSISSPSTHHQKAWSFLLTRTVLGEILQQDPKILEIDRVGKPVLSSPQATLHFNVSHSENLWIIAWSFDQEVGVDVQKIDTGIKYQAIMRQFFTASERAKVTTVFDFFDIWTQKEAVLKLRGLSVAHMPKISTDSTMLIPLDIVPEFKTHLAV